MRNVWWIYKLKAKKLKGIEVLIGSQRNQRVLLRCVRESGGGFDVIVNDGGHTSNSINNSFDVLWESLAPGGLYFIEDLHVSRHPGHEDSEGAHIMPDVIEAWIELLLISSEWVKPDLPPRVTDMRDTHPLPSNVDKILCQYEACVIAKAGKEISTSMPSSQSGLEKPMRVLFPLQVSLFQRIPKVQGARL